VPEQGSLFHKDLIMYYTRSGAAEAPDGASSSTGDAKAKAAVRNISDR
jgi:hypothetical protein